MTYNQLKSLSISSVVLAVGLISSGCSSSDTAGKQRGPSSEVTNLDGDAELSDLDALFQDAPDNSTLPDEGKADAVYPPLHTGLIELQSPVKSQASRGVCSIFSTVALMEHLYISEGTLTNPDFSEQYLQWSVKTEVGAFTKTEGSNARSNLDAIHRFGIVEEGDWPYQTKRWNSSDDAACTGEDDQPLRCYTNGEPPEAAKNAQKWTLPRGRWVSSNDRSIKAHMTTKKQAAIVGLTFFYQSWNHRGSKLPTSNALWRKGVVTYPNDEDKTKSLEKRAGHSILLVGWDDELEAESRDGEGKPVLDAEGNPVKEKGFFIFKNSWGTGSFGVENPHGNGYGYISMKYVKEYGSVYVSNEPEVEIPDEVCNDEIDNDRDGDADCDDSDCASDAACTGSTSGYTNSDGGDIPDNDPAGLKSDIVVTEGGTIEAVSVTVDITHTFRGDLTVKLVRDSGGEVVLHDQEGASEDDLKKTFSVGDFNGEDAAGTWSLVITDNANLDAGKLNSWTLDITRCSGPGCGGGATNYASTESAAIPDGDTQGVSTDIVINDPGAIASLSVNVDITHPYKGDLTIKLQKLLANEAILLTADASSGAFMPRSFSVSDFDGVDTQGTWRLVVIDVANGDTGTLNGWSMDVTR